MTRKLYVGNLDAQTTADDLSQLFAGAGNVLSARVITDRDTQRSKGFAFVEMANDAEALQAISLYNGHLLHSHNIQVNEAQPRSASSDFRSSQTVRTKFREVKHKVRGGRKPRRY
jgi:cold-inducible RNA-binding protein